MNLEKLKELEADVLEAEDIEEYAQATGRLMSHLGAVMIDEVGQCVAVCKIGDKSYSLEVKEVDIH
jgi:hypothetical protein